MTWPVSGCVLIWFLISMLNDLRKLRVGRKVKRRIGRRWGNHLLIWLIDEQNQWKPLRKCRNLGSWEILTRGRRNLLKRLRQGKKRCSNYSRVIWVKRNVQVALREIAVILDEENRRVLSRANRGMFETVNRHLYALLCFAVSCSSVCWIFWFFKYMLCFELCRYFQVSLPSSASFFANAIKCIVIGGFALDIFKGLLFLCCWMLNLIVLCRKCTWWWGLLAVYLWRHFLIGIKNCTVTAIILEE